MSMMRHFALLILLTVSPATTWAQGGPPLITDDPDTPGPRHWEINFASVIESSTLHRQIEAPLVDLNYGVGRRIQLKLEMPWMRVREGNEAFETGAGDAFAGVKWRFLGQEGTRVAWSVYPQFAFNTSQSSIVRGIVDRGHEVLLPTELTVEFAHVEINGEAGRNFVEHRPDDWILGASTEGTVSRRLELLAEFHAEQTPGETSERFVNIGARPRLTRRIMVLLAAGRTVTSHSAESRVYIYTGLQLNLPDQFSFKDVDLTAVNPRARR